MPARRVKARLTGYKAKRGQGVKRSRKTTGLVKKAKASRKAKYERRLVKSYQRAKFYRQPTMGLPESQVVRMSFAYTVKHPGFAGIDDSQLTHFGRYTWLDFNQSGANANSGPFACPMGIIRANDISAPLEQPYVPNHNSYNQQYGNKVTQFSDYGKFYRTFQVLGSSSKVSFRYLKRPDTVSNLQGGAADTFDITDNVIDEKHINNCPPVMLWMTQNTGDKNADGIEESLIPLDYTNLIEVGPKVHKMATKIIDPAKSFAAHTLSKKWSCGVAKKRQYKFRSQLVEDADKAAPKDPWTGMFPWGGQDTVQDHVVSPDDDVHMSKDIDGKSPANISRVRFGAMIMLDRPIPTPSVPSEGAAIQTVQQSPYDAVRMPPSLITIKVDYLVKVQGRKLIAAANNQTVGTP